MIEASVFPQEPELLLPPEKVSSCLPELSIVIPALNEQLTIGEFIDWCWEGIREANVRAEILIIDSSTDKTAEIALSKGARVLRTPKRGLGRAYIWTALPFVRGKYLLLGDCDCTYDFRQLTPFLEKFRQGSEYIMGSRFRGFIEPGAMPPLHRYFGTPLTTAILNVLFGSRFSDIHCGMRGITLDAFKRMNLESQSWQYASEMVIKSVQLDLRTSEVPIRFLKDKAGRLSHHKRSGWLSPWIAGWINLRAMLVHGSEFFLFRPGLLLLAAGLLLSLPLSLGPLRIYGITFSIFWLLLGVSLSIVGLQSLYMGILANVIFDYGHLRTARWLKIFDFNRTVLISAILFVIGLVPGLLLIWVYYLQDFALRDVTRLRIHLVVFGLELMITGFLTFTFTLLLHGIVPRLKK